MEYVGAESFPRFSEKSRKFSGKISEMGYAMKFDKVRGIVLGGVLLLGLLAVLMTSRASARKEEDREKNKLTIQVAGLESIVSVREACEEALATSRRLDRRVDFTFRFSDGQTITELVAPQDSVGAILEDIAKMRDIKK